MAAIQCTMDMGSALSFRIVVLDATHDPVQHYEEGERARQADDLEEHAEEARTLAR